MTTEAQPTELDPAQLSDALPVVQVALAQILRRLPSHVSRDDLASAGKIALVRALRQVRGPRSEVHAYVFTRVRGAILDELRRQDPLSRRARTKVKLFRSVALTIEQRSGRKATEQEIARGAGVGIAQVQAVQGLVEATRPVYLDEAGEDGSPVRELADPGASRPGDALASADAVSALRRAIGRLPEPQARVLRRYYFEEATLEEIAREAGVSKERIRQIREAAERRLRGDPVLQSLA